MRCNVAAQQFAVEPAQVAHQLMEVVTTPIDAEIDAHMSQLGMVVDKEHPLVMTLNQVHRNMDCESSRPHSSLNTKECKDRPADGITGGSGAPQLIDAIQCLGEGYLVEYPANKVITACSHRA